MSESPLAVVSPSVAGLPLWVATASLSAAVMHSGWRWHPFVGAIFAILAGTRGESVVFVSRPLSVHLAKPQQPFFVLGLISLESSHLRFIPSLLESSPRVPPLGPASFSSPLPWQSPQPFPCRRSSSLARWGTVLPSRHRCWAVGCTTGGPPLGLPCFRPTGSRQSILGGHPLRPPRSVEGLWPLFFCGPSSLAESHGLSLYESVNCRSLSGTPLQLLSHL